jgi:hypothetical protein
MKPRFTFIIATILILISCQNPLKKKSTEKDSVSEVESKFKKGQYGYDLEFLLRYLKPVELINGNSRVILSSEYQGRIMTSTSSGLNGFSYGWINYDLISSSKILDNFNPYGGEERIWLGPEGGQFSLFFEKGTSFKNGKWIVPAPFDREPFEVENKDSSSITFSRKIDLKNYSGTVFNTKIMRKVTLLNSSQIIDILGIKAGKSINSVGYQSENRLINIGNNLWNKQNGALSIWLLSMLNASPEVTVIMPYRKGNYGKIVKDDYLGEIPANRLKVSENAVFFRADGQFRSKIGISPQRALPFFGSYDIRNNILTIVEYSLPENVTDYVNSALEIQENPFSGDVINSYNDGPNKNGSQMGIYYELEASSPAAFLKQGEEMVYVQRTYHFEGKEDDLNLLTTRLLKVSIEDIKNAFKF